jgi:predicted transcriptional regulator
MTVMNNLVKKHLLAQDKTAIAYVYTPEIPGREVAQTVLVSVVHKLIDDKTATAVSMLMELDKDLTPEQLDELRDIARDKYGV